MTVAQKMTAEEFLALPVETGRMSNLVEGELVVNQPSLEHQELATRLLVALGNWVDAAPSRGLAIKPIDVLIDDRNVYAADILWYAEGRRPARRSRPPYPVPDLAIEVRSPSTWRYDLGAKKAGYERRGLKELWLVDTPASAVLVHRRSAPDAPTFDLVLELAIGDALTSPLLDGFELPLDRLFAAD